MILKASQRGGGIQLARHLLNSVDNDHVTVHELRGFASDKLAGAFAESYALSRSTKCRQFLFSLSLNPPENENVSVEIFEKAIADIETNMGLSGQPRAIVFHEKQGRRHAHCVWSRINVNEMKAINLPHFKLKLRDKSRELFFEHGWQMPKGLMNSKARNPRNFTLAEWQQANRTKQDPREIKQIFQECWAVSDGLKAFTHALEERGYYLCKGNRRGHVAVDWRGEVYAVSRWAGVKAKEVRAKLGNADNLPTVDDTKERLADELEPKLKDLFGQATARHNADLQRLEMKRRALVIRQRREREELRQAQTARAITETKSRAERLPTGLQALWHRVTGKYQRTKQKIEEEFVKCLNRDFAEQTALINCQLSERRRLQHQIQKQRQFLQVLENPLQMENQYAREGTTERQNERICYTRSQ